jgi:3-hydroxybutyryl-CoA dehydrogenase
MNEIGVVGTGTIGVCVAQTLAQTGHQVILVDIAGDILDRARKDIEQGLRLAALIDAEVRRDSHADILSRIDFTTDYGFDPSREWAAWADVLRKVAADE